MKRDRINPCAVCGWSEHMAVHRPLTSGPRKGQPYDHAYQPVKPSARPYRNRDDKPPATASVFSHAAWFLADYAELWYEMGPHDGAAEEEECHARCTELSNLADRLKMLAGEWDAKREAGPLETAALIIAGMLAEWELPGVVLYSLGAKRWRVVGRNYKLKPDETCIGIYAPGVTAGKLLEDMLATDPTEQGAFK